MGDLKFPHDMAQIRHVFGNESSGWDMGEKVSDGIRTSEDTRQETDCQGHWPSGQSALEDCEGLFLCCRPAITMRMQRRVIEATGTRSG